MFAASDLKTRVKGIEKEKSGLVTAIKLVQSSDKSPSHNCEVNKASNSNDAEAFQANQNNGVQHSKPESISFTDDDSFHLPRPLKRNISIKKRQNSLNRKFSMTPLLLSNVHITPWTPKTIVR